MGSASSRIPVRVTHNLSRALIALFVLTLAAPAAARAAAAAGGDREVPRSTGFGGACPKCELSGRRLAGAHFLGADFSAAALVGSDLREAHVLASNFTGAHLSRAHLTDAHIPGTIFAVTNIS